MKQDSCPGCRQGKWWKHDAMGARETAEIFGIGAMVAFAIITALIAIDASAAWMHRLMRLAITLTIAVPATFLHMHYAMHVEGQP